MGNKMKKLICALLASAMVVSSVGIVGFADADTADDTADVTVTDTVDTADTDTADETETTDETDTADEDVTEAAPAASSSAYDDDAYYQKALSLCSALGIITGYEDGSIKPDSNVTRAEMASIVLRMLAVTSMSAYQNGFTDVEATHWAADQIQTAQEASIISGMGDGTFQPDGNVTYAQVIVMLVNALNYQQDAEYYGTNGGHWASGYIKVANLSDLDLLKNAPGSNDVASERGVVIKMVYNALLAQYKEITSYSNGLPVYSSNGTLAKAKFDLIDKKGVLLGTSKTTISGSDLADNQIEILGDDDEKSEVFDCSLTGLEDYLAQKVTYYYRENSGLTPEVLAVTYDSSKTTSETIDADDIEDIAGFEASEGSIKVETVSKKKDCSGATIVYNGKVLTASEQKEIEDINDFLTPEVGSIRIVDSDRDNVFDVVFVDSYETVVVSSVGTDRLTGKISSAVDADTLGDTVAYSLNLDDSIDRVVTVTRAGVEVKVRNLKKNDVATIRRSYDNSVVDIVVTGESVAGSASSVSKKFNQSYATIAGEKYEVANIAAGDLKTSTQAIFYFDMFGRIGYIESSGTGQLQSGEKYGWIMNGYKAEDGSGYVLQIMTTDGKAVEFSAGTKLDYWAPDATEATTLSGDTVTETIQALMASDGSGFITSSTGVQLRLVKYKANSTNTLSRLYCAVDSTKVSDEDALRIYPTNLGGIGSASNLVGGYQINDGILEISVPKNASDMKDAANYKFGEVTSSSYVVRENGAGFDFVIGEFTSSISPSLAIKFTDSADAVAYVGDIDTAANNPVMVIEEIDKGVDDEDNVVYTINGYVNGAEASVTTTKNTSIAKIKAPRGSNAIGDKYDENGNKVTGSRMYNHTKLWDAQNGFIESQASTFDDVISKGDVILYETSGDRIIKLFDADEVYTAIKEGEDGDVMFGAKDNYNTRNMFYFEALEEYELDDVAWIAQKDLSRISFDSSKLMDTIEININTGKVTIDTEGSEISDLIVYDPETKTGDYVFARLCDKGTLQEIIIYRFVN